MKCSLGLFVLYQLIQRYRLGSTNLYYDKPLTRDLEGGETRLARVLFRSYPLLHVQFLTIMSWIVDRVSWILNFASSR